MAKTKNQKKEIIDSYLDKINSSKAFYVVKTFGLKPNDVNQFRKELRKVDGAFSLIKNSLFNLALKNKNISFPEELNQGQHSVVFSSENVSESSKLLVKFLEDKENNEVKYGYMENRMLSKDDIVYLATLPSKDELYAKLLRTLNNPVSSFVNGLAFNIRGLINVINSIKEHKI